VPPFNRKCLVKSHAAAGNIAETKRLFRELIDSLRATSKATRQNRADGGDAYTLFAEEAQDILRRFAGESEGESR